MDCLVSIIVPIYNQENNLSTSIPSLMRQDYQNIEIIAVNDGSTDQSEHIIDEYIQVDDRIRKINKANGGLVDAVITGIEAANGKYICFVDPDDEVKNDFVSTFIDNIETYDFLAMGYVENNGEHITQHCLEADKVFNKDDIRDLKNRFIYDYSRGTFSYYVIFDSRCNKCYRAECLKKLLDDLKKIKMVSMGEDTIFTYLLLNYVSSGKSLSRCNGYIYNTNSMTSMTKNNSAKTNYKNARLAYECLKKIATEKKDNDSQSRMLYYSQIMTIITRLQKEYNEDLRIVYSSVKKDFLFWEACRIVNKGIYKAKFWLLFHMGAKNYHRYCKIKKIFI